jgi:hypothetical protein
VTIADAGTGHGRASATHARRARSAVLIQPGGNDEHRPVPGATSPLSAVADVVRGDLTVGLAYVTPAGGAVVTAVAPCGIADEVANTVGFTTSLGFGRKLERIVREPKVALAYHAREHGFSTDPRFVLVQGIATADLTPSPERIDAFAPQAARYLGELKRGPVWDRLLREYYQERVFVDIAVERVAAWPTLDAAGPAVVGGSARPGPAAPQSPPAKGTAPRVDVDKLARRLSSLPHRLLAYRGPDGYPVIVPIELAGHGEDGLRLVGSEVLPAGGRRAGILAHAYRPQLVGLSTQVLTGWLEVGEDGAARYSPHTSKGFTAPPSKRLLLVSNGLLAKRGVRVARKQGVAERLAAAAANRPALDRPAETR